MSTARSLRVFVCSPDATFAAAAAAALPAPRFEALSGTDPRAVRAFAQAGSVDAVLVHARFQKPSADDIARVLRKALGEVAALVLLADTPSNLADDSPFDASIKSPAGPGVVADKVARAVTARRRGASGPDRSIEAEIELRHARLAGQTLYEILDVRPDASTDAITRAYDRLSLQFHPDRLRHLKGTDLESWGLELYVRVGEAARILRSRADRQRYDESLRRGAPAGAPVATTSARSAAATVPLDELTQNPRAKKALKVAQDALRGGDRAMALVQLRFALTLDGDNALLRERAAEIEAEAAKK